MLVEIVESEDNVKGDGKKASENLLLTVIATGYIHLANYRVLRVRDYYFIIKFIHVVVQNRRSRCCQDE